MQKRRQIGFDPDKITNADLQLASRMLQEVDAELLMIDNLERTIGPNLYINTEKVTLGIKRNRIDNLIDRITGALRKKHRLEKRKDGGENGKSSPGNK